MTDRCYRRISLDTERSGSIDKQTSALKRRAEPGAVFYEDRSTSGSIPFAERPDGARLLADLQPGDRVLVTKIDRAARDVLDLLGLVKRVKAIGASIIFTEQADVVTEGPMGDLLLTLLGAVAQFERALIAERRRESLAAFKEEGRHAVGRAPFGLASVANPSGRGLVLRPHPEEGPVLREVVARLLAGESQSSLAPLVGMGKPSFSRLLRNDRLAGVLGHGPDGPRIDPEQALFSLVEWRELQDYLARPEKSWTRSDGYGAALLCGVCGERLYLNKSKRKAEYATYRCRKTADAHRKEGRPSVSVMQSTADRHIETDFLARFGAEPVLEEVTVTASAARDEALAVARLRLEAAQRDQRDARDREARRKASAAVDAALDALEDAEALPDETVIETRDTGMTHAELWQMLPPDERAAFVVSAGRWSVAPGRGLPIDQKVTFVPPR